MKNIEMFYSIHKKKHSVEGDSFKCLTRNSIIKIKRIFTVPTTWCCLHDKIASDVLIAKAMSN